MIWKGKELNTIGDVMKFGIDKCETFEEAQEFVKSPPLLYKGGFFIYIWGATA